MLAKDLKTLSKDELQKIIMKMEEFLSENQLQKLQEIIQDCSCSDEKNQKETMQVRMSQEFIDEKMLQIREWKRQIDEGELYLNIEEYEDYSSGYWDADWVTEYYDNCGLGAKLEAMVRFAGDCVDDRRYREANEIYEWLWEMSVSTDSEYGDPVDLEILAENNLMHIDMEKLALLTLYADYQVLQPEKRAADIYHYFVYGTFHKLHIEEMFYVGRESLKDTDQFWKDWIELLKNKNGDVEVRLLKEAILYCEGIKGLSKLADENSAVHPSLYLSVMEEYEKGRMYERIEATGTKAVEALEVNLTIRSEIALKAAVASSYLQNEEKMMQFCWECFRSDSDVKNYLRLFGTEKMANKYGMQGREVLRNIRKGKEVCDWRKTEFHKNVISDYEYYELSFYTGDFETAKVASKNPEGSLGWSSSFVQKGIRLFLLYLYEKSFPSKAAANTAAYIGFADTKEAENLTGFEREILEESREHKVSEFWNYFQHWKRYFPMEINEKKRYMTWVEKIVFSRADAIVSGQHRNHYGQAAVLLAMVGEIKESVGLAGAGIKIFEEYKRKFPRHSSFQREMKNYFSRV